MSSARVFIAIPLTTRLKDNIGTFQAQLQNTVSGIRWSPVKTLHLTLHFFGDIPQENLEKIKVSMLSVKRCHAPFEVAVKGLGGFPGRRRSRVVWLGLEPTEPLESLHRDIQKSIAEAGFQVEGRSYSPHLTIGRARQGVVDISAACVTLSDTPLGHLVVDRMVLFESQLKRDGAVHIPLFTVNFDE